MPMTAGPAALLLDNLALTASLSGGDWVAGLGLSRLLEPSVKETVARCANGAGLIDVTWSVDVKWDTLFLAGGTLGRGALYRLTWFDAGGAVLASLPWTRCYPPSAPVAARGWRAGNFWSGAPRDRDLTGKTRGLIARPAVNPRCRKLRIEIDNRGASLDLGYLFIAASVRPVWPHDWGLSFGANAASLVATSPMGKRIIDRRPHPRTKAFLFKELSEAEAMALHDAGLSLQFDGPLAMIEDVRRSGNWWRRAWLATLADGGIEVKEVGPDRWEAGPIKLLEIVA